MNKTLRDLVGQEDSVENPRSDVEDRIGARLPGDDLTDHPLAPKPNPYMRVAFFDLMELLQEGGITLDEERQVRAALVAQRGSHAAPFSIPRSTG